MSVVGDVIAKSELQLFEIERLDRAQSLLELPKNIAVGSIVIIPAILVVVGYQRWDRGMASQSYFTAAGLAFVGFILLASLLNIAQWVFAKKLLDRLRYFDLRLLEQFRVPEGTTRRFGPFLLTKNGSVIEGKRPFVAFWRIHRRFLALVAFVALMGYLFVLLPTVWGNVSVFKLIKLVLAGAISLLAIWYSRLPQTISWSFDCSDGQLRTLRLAGWFGINIRSIRSDRVSRLNIRPTGLFTGKGEYEICSESDRIALPIESFSLEPKTINGRANRAMSSVRLVQLLVFVNRTDLIRYEDFEDPVLRDVVVS